MDQLFKRNFEYIYSKLTNNPNFRIEKERDIKYISSFLSEVNKRYKGSFQENTLWEYMIFTFNVYEGLSTRFGKNNIQVNWVASKKGLDRWDNKKPSYLFFNRNFCKKYNISKESIQQEVQKKTNSIYKDMERKRFFNTEKGFLNCSYLLIFDKYNDNCLKCDYYKICKNK